MLVSALERFFTTTAPLSRGDRLVVAFSGGSDSTALLWSLIPLAQRRGITLIAAHLDHGLDPESEDRADRAEALARGLGVRSVRERRAVGDTQGASESLEAAARRVRYRFLEEVRRNTGARFVATAHHRDDQLETLLLRLCLGTGLAGLSGIRARYGRVVRPLLDLPRHALACATVESGLEPVADPTNCDRRHMRNRLRHGLVPDLVRRDPRLPELALCLARTAAGAGRAIGRVLADRLDVTAEDRGASLDRVAFEALPAELEGWALALLHRAAGAAYPPRRHAAHELVRQLAGGGAARCDACGQWQWRACTSRVRVTRRQSVNPATPPFSYTLRIPGELWIPEISVGLRLVPGESEPWMFRAQERRAGLALDLEPGTSVLVRNRRPNDRVHAFGGVSRHLKGVLSARRISPEQRSRIPLLCTGNRILWVPGITQDETTRIPNPPDRCSADSTPALTRLPARPIWIASLFGDDSSRDDLSRDDSLDDDPSRSPGIPARPRPFSSPGELFDLAR